MTLSFEVEPYGPRAARALGQLITSYQGDDPLARVTVVVAGGPVGLATRRLLASDRLGPWPRAGSGIANVSFVTLSRLAEQIGAPLMAAEGRRPATDAVVHAAARRLLVHEAGPLFSRVADHPATLSALVATYRELRHVPVDALQTAAATSARAAEVIHLVTAIADSLEDWFDDVDLARAATRAIHDSPESALAEIGPVVVYLPLTMVPGHIALVHALADHGPVAVLLGTTGDAVGDEPSEELARRLGWNAPWPKAEGAPFPQKVVSTPSADAEVLEAVRDLMGRASGGTALERMAVVHAGQAPYPRLIRELLAQSGIPLNGREVRTLASTAAGRILLGLFSCMDHDWRRDDVMAWLATAPIYHEGHPVPATAWDAISIAAGVTSGLNGWRTHLSDLAQSETTRMELLDQDGEHDEGARRHVHRTITHCGDLSTFIDALATRLTTTPNTWRELSTWSRRLMADLVGGSNQAANWPAAEAAAFTALDEVLAGLAVLDAIDGAPSLVAFRSVVASALDGPAPQTSRFGRGVMVGQVDELAGLDFDVVYVVGMSDGAFPGRVSDDALLPDRERAAHIAIPLRSSKVAERRRNYLAALSSAPERVISFARGDQRGGREQRPSRWLLDALAHNIGDGKRLYSSDLDELHETNAFKTLLSFVSVVADNNEPVSVADRDARSLLQSTRSGRRLSDHFLVRSDHVLRLGLEAQQARRSPALTRFDGLVEGMSIPSPAAGAVQSPTGLETYAACPRRYLFERLLRIEGRDRPEEIMTISALDRGVLMHAIVERFMREQTTKAVSDRIRPITPWGEGDQAHLVELAEEEFASFEQRGLTGRQLFWDRERTRILADLRRFLIDDSLYRAETGSVPEAVEFRFGHDDIPPVVMAVEGGREVRFRGSVDRIDRIDGTADGESPISSYLVIDYKTGGTYGIDALKDDPVARGTKLQLPIYAAAAAQQFKASVTTSSYWFVSEKGQYQRFDYRPTTPGSDRVGHVLGILVDGIEGGAFPGRPKQETEGVGGNCHFCPYNDICPLDRQRSWEHKSSDPVLSSYRELADGDGSVAVTIGAAHGH